MQEPDLYSPISVLTGVGTARAAALKKLGIQTLYDLISFFPRDYQDRRKTIHLCDVEGETPFCFRGTVISEPRTSHIRKGMDLTKVFVSDMTGRVQLVFFNRPYVVKQLRYGCDYYFYGQLREGYGLQIQNPEVETIEARGQKTGRILPIYPLTAGISNTMLVEYIRQALQLCLDKLPEILPGSIRRDHRLCDAAFAYKTIHAPDSFEALAEARRRVIFDEFFVFTAGLMLLRTQRSQATTEPWRETELTPLLQTLPYALTGAQKRAIEDIAGDLRQPHPMNRLVQGDVGSGKTVVAAAAAYLAQRAGKQAALMAPTEILAEQHMKSLGTMLGALGIEVVLLTGSMPASVKKWTKERIADGKAQLIIGTHALLTGDVRFHDLGLVITDEQHRFGVGQRAALAEKSNSPHKLFLSATPIPRTLGMILYGDMDVSVIDELPPGRQTIDTFAVDETMRERIHGFIRKQVTAGNQVYVVCPAVEDNPETGLKSAQVWAEHLQREVFPDLRIGLLHGKMKGEEKDAVMRQFSRHELDVLVSTTVIEVGVDVPNATLMVIEDADRFGLSQLHQLRGRVGRGQDKSYCILISSRMDADAKRRMNILCKTGDGFRIAEEDLAMRGPGDLFGNRQHGLPQFKVANLALDMKTLQEAQQAAQILSRRQVMEDPAFLPLLRRIQALFSENPNILN